MLKIVKIQEKNNAISLSMPNNKVLPGHAPGRSGQVFMFLEVLCLSGFKNT